MTSITAKVSRVSLVPACLLLIVSLLTDVCAKAANFPVTNGNDAGAGSLRQAIINANAAVGPHTITFTYTGVINLASALPAITRAGITIDGGGNITINAQGGNIVRDIFTLNTGANNTILRGMTLQNTGSDNIKINGALSGVVIEDIIIRHTVNDWINHGIYVAAAATNMTIRNVTMTDIEDAMWGIRFVSTVNGLTINNYHISNGTGNAGRGIQFQAAASNVTIKNSTIDLDDPATADDGDYGVYFNTTATGLVIDSCTFHDTERYGVFIGSNAANVQIKHTAFDNFDGWTNTKMIFFNGHATTVMVDSIQINLDLNNSTNDGDFGMYFYGNMQNVTIQKSTFIEADSMAIWSTYKSGVTVINNDNVTITNNTFERNGSGSTISGAIQLIGIRTESSDSGPIVISNNTFRNNNGICVFQRPGNGGNYAIPNYRITNNTFTGNKAPAGYGIIQTNYLDRIVILQNSIYNNVGKLIDHTDGTNANCTYEGANTPLLLSSAETTPGVYTVRVQMPALCGTGGCTLELFSSEANLKGVNAQHYVQTFTGVSQGIQTFTGVTGAFPEITGELSGTWSATLRNGTCGTSEFSNKIAMKPRGPAGVTDGVKLWLRGDDILAGGAEPTASGQLISGWEEFSGGGAPAANSIINNPLTKLNGINFNPVADMDGDGIRGVFSGAASWITTPTTTSVAVFNPLSATANADRFFVLFSQAGSDYNVNQAQIEWFRTGNNVQSYRGSTLLNPPTPGTTGVTALNRPGVFTSVTSATNHTGYYNGANMGSGNYSKGNFAISQWFVGTGYNTTDGWANQAETDFAEVCTYNRVLTAGELQKVQSYLALKYGIALKQNYILSDSTVIWNVTTNATHSKQIAGLVRDDKSVFQQKQAKAFHPDEAVTIGLGNALAITNNENAGTIANNLSVLMWGNDSASVLYNTAYVTSFSDARMTRVWKVQKTNWSDTSIIIKLKGGNINRTLLVSADPTFPTASTTNYPLNDTGAVILNSSVLGNGMYFTFANKIAAPACVTLGIQAWYRADDANAANGAWTDYSGYDRTATQATAANQPVRVNNGINFNPAFDFDGSNDYLNIPHNLTIAGTNPFTVISITKRGTPANSDQIMGQQSDATNSLSIGFSTNNKYGIGATGVGAIYTTGTYPTANIPYLNATTRSGNVFNLYTNGAADGTGTQAYNFLTINQRIGWRGGAIADFFDGNISELVVYNRALNAAELLQVNSYLALKYGITLNNGTTNYIASNGSTTMWEAAVNAAYNKDIAGIGKDTCGNLHQKQSRSINTGALVTMALGDAIAPDNPSNTNTVTNNLSFLTWGDNGGAITYGVVASGANVTSRMTRVWKVDKTNWADQHITIRLNASARNTYLLISNTDGTFATIDQELAMNADSTITINSSLLPDGAYFTFGKEILGPGYVNPGVQLWLRADDGVSAPATWYDFSGNGADAAQATAANQPVLTAAASNFNPAFRFNGTSHYMDVPYNAGFNGNITVYTVHSQTATSGIRTPISSRSFPGNQSKGWNYYRNVSTRELWTGNNSSGTAWSVLPGGTTALGTEIVGLDATLGSGNAVKHIYSNGQTVGTVTNGTYITNTTAPLRIGSSSEALNFYWNGDIVETVVYNRVLSAIERSHVESYLALKYGITLNQTTPTDYVATDWDGTTGTKMWTASKNTGYGFRIAGIGRDELTKLYQKQSRNAEANALITIAAGDIIAADNVSNTADIDDLSFFTWSDNNLATTFSVAVSGVPNATGRMARVWKVDRTNWADQDITIKADQIGVRYLLVNATDPTFGAGTTEYAINTTTGSVTINTADLPDGAYFTLATKIVGPGCVNTNILAWLRADYGATGGADWNDFSGNLNKVNQPTAASQPSLVGGGLNFNPAMNFDGSNDWYNLPATLYNANDSITAFFITRTDNVTPNWMTLAEFGEDRPGLYWNLGAPNAWVATANPLSSPHTRKFTTSSPALFTFTLPNSNPKNYKVGANGLEQTFTGSAGTFSIGAGNANKRLGGLVVDRSQVNFDGFMGEVVFYKGVVTNADKQRIHSYLALKYGITLDQTTPTDYVASDWNGTTGTRMWTAADNTGYNVRITGVGRDDCDALHQKQSRSVESRSLVTIAMGSEVAATNADKADSITNNNSYFVFADNNLDTAYSVPLTAAGITATVRMPRVWKVDKTNWADADITLKYHRNTSRVYLLISTDPTFATDVHEEPLNTDSIVNLSSSLLPDGAYFTFAKEVYGPGYVNNGVQLWLRADDGISTNAEWNDFSGNENHAVQGTTASQPAAVAAGINYNPVFDFDGTDDYMDIISGLGISGANPFTVGGLGMRQTAGTWDAYVAQPGSNTNDYFFGYSTTNVTGTGATGVSSILGTTAYGANVPNVIGVKRSGNNFGFFANGRSDGSVTATYSFNVDNTRIGNRGASADLAFDGYMGEVFVYNRALSSTEQLKIHSYLSLKYGITLANGDSNYVATNWDGTTGTIYWNAAANAGYKNNITGIGRDDSTNLLQKQSRSVNTAANGNMLAIGLVSIAATNLANTGTFTDDLSFMVWGDNGLTGTRTTEYPTTLDPNGCSKITRLQREWKVQETGSVGFVQVKFYLAGLVPNSTTISDLTLLVDDDGDFSSGTTTTITPSAYDAATQTVTFTDVDFADGQYFTLVTDLTNEAPGGVLTGLYSWYRADKGVTTATGVSQWNDQSTSLKNATQATGTAQPVYNSTGSLINFNPNLSLNSAASQVLTNATISHTATNGEDIFAVVGLPTANTPSQTIVGLGTVASSANTTELRCNTGSLAYVVNSSSVVYTAASNGQVLLANANRTSGGTGAIVVNGSQVASNAVTPVATLNQLNIGSRRLTAANSLFYTGQVAEIAIYNRQLNTAEREKVASYLAIKYGITLSHNYAYPNSTVIWDQALNTGYANNITGIGRDDCNGLHQKQSKSINASAMVTMAAGPVVETSNAANLNVLENNTALLFGDNNGAINTWTSTESPASRQRIAREWKTQVTGTVGSVTIQLPASTSTATVKLPAVISNMYMLVDADGDFSSGATEVLMEQNGNNWEASYEFTGNEYFTFATGTGFLTLNANVILQGAWNGTAMRTDLKTAGVLPATDPYGKNTTPSVSPNAAAAQVVDWILVELRDATNPATVVTSRAALVLSNGNVVDTNYAAGLSIYGVDEGDYYVSIRHRNHLGVLSLNTVNFSTGAATIDFTNTATATYGSDAQVSLGSGIMGMWAGNVTGDRSIRHSAKPSDASAIANAVLTHSGNTTADPAYTGFNNVYNVFDVNLDGKVYYTATPSDHAIIHNNVKTHPANTWSLASYIVIEQLP